MHSLSFSWIHFQFAIFFANSFEFTFYFADLLSISYLLHGFVWIHNLFHEFTARFCEFTMNSFFGGITLNSPYLSRIHYFFREFTSCNGLSFIIASVISQHKRLRFRWTSLWVKSNTVILRIHYLFSESTLNSLSFSLTTYYGFDIHARFYSGFHRLVCF